MDSPKPPSKAAHLLDDLESIRALLDNHSAEPPLLTDSLDPNSIPLLCEVVDPRPAGAAATPRSGTLPPPARPPMPPATPAAPAAAPTTAAAPAESADPTRINRELRAAAQLILQEVIDDFVPQIEAELQRRLEARLQRLLQTPRKP